MSDEAPDTVDLWDVLDEADEAVRRWPAWQQRYEADVYYDEDAPEGALKAMFTAPAIVYMRVAVGAIH